MKKVTKVIMMAIMLSLLLLIAATNYRIASILIIFVAGISFFTRNKKTGLKKKQIVFQS